MKNWIIPLALVISGFVAYSVYANQKVKENKIIPEQVKETSEPEVKSIEAKKSSPFSFISDTFDFITIPKISLPTINNDAIGGDFNDTGQAKARSRQ